MELASGTNYIQGSVIKQNLIYAAGFVTLALLVSVIAIGVIGLYVPVERLPLMLRDINQTLGHIGSLTCLIAGSVLFASLCVYLVRQYRLNTCINQLIQSGILKPDEVGYMRTSSGWRAVWYHNHCYLRSPADKTLSACLQKLKKQCPQDPFLIRGEFRVKKKSVQFFDQVVADLLQRKNYETGSIVWYRTSENLYQTIQLELTGAGLYSYQTDNLEVINEMIKKSRGEFDLGTETLRKFPDCSVAAKGTLKECERKSLIEAYLNCSNTGFLESGDVVCFQIKPDEYASCYHLEKKTIHWSQIYSNPEIALRALRNEFHDWENRWNVLGLYTVSTQKLIQFNDLAT